MSKVVDNVRKKIDALDNTIHDLLMERADLVLKIGEAKRKNNIQVVQPDREAVMIRRLLARHKGPLPREAVVRIWRELVGAVSLLQTGLRVAVCVPDDHTGLMYWDMAKDYFSSVLPMQKATNALGALAAVRENDVTFAVLPWPEDSQENPWWLYMLSEEGDEGIRITSRLPLGDRKKDDNTPEFRALVVTRGRFESSNEDRSFIAYQFDSEVSRARLVDAIREAGLTPRAVYAAGASDEGASRSYLVEIDSYVSPEDEVVQTVLNGLDCDGCRSLCLGGYPVPPVYEDKVGKGVDDRPSIALEEKKTA